MFGSLGVFLGGLMSFITVSLSYITDVTPEENRAVRYACKIYNRGVVLKLRSSSCSIKIYIKCHCETWCFAIFFMNT